MVYEALLEAIGLTKGEITVYLALLKLGQTTTGKIIETAGISSGKIYEILDKLIRKGLASYIIREKTKYFTAADPNRILDYMAERESEHKRQEEELKKALPELKALQIGVEKKYGATIYKGLRGMQTVAFEALRELKPGDEVLAMGLVSRKEKAFNLMWKRWHTERVRRKIRCKVIFSDRGSEYYAHFRKMKHTEVRVMQGLTPAAVDIIGDKVLIFTHIEPSCLAVTSDEIRQSFTQFFNTLWKIAKV
jgi:sugar-specific transcriptional regulator TrmB